MAILEDDIHLVISKVMGDVPEGGGGPTSTEVIDGASNLIFPDISEVDRAGGVVNMAKIFVSVQTPDVDRFLGSNIIVAEPPEDPNVSVTLYATGQTFDTREEAKSRLEAYLAPGATYAGYLFGTHIEGQSVIAFIQQETAPIPVTGQTLLLRKAEGTNSPTEQYVRLTTVSSEVRTFEDSQGPYTRRVVTAGLTDRMRQDFPGFDASRIGPSQTDLQTKTIIRDTVVADAARYYGVVKLKNPVTLGDTVVDAESIFTSIVPSAQVETPIIDARMNQQTAGLVETDGTVSDSVVATWTTTQALYVGGSVLPGTLTVTRSGYTVTDQGGKLYAGDTQVGTIDYANGVLTLSNQPWASPTDLTTIAYTVAAQASIVTDTISIPVTAEGQRLTYIQTLVPIPTKGSLQVSYRAQGRWYTLQEDGSGAIRGTDSAYGAGSLNFTTGTAAITLGALPDVGSEVMFAFASSAAAVDPVTNPVIASKYLNFRKQIKLDRAIEPGTLTITWNDGTARTSSDVDGELNGAATGNVMYGLGLIEFSPNVLPAKGTTINVSLTDAQQTALTFATLTDGGSSWTGTLGGVVKARSVRISVPISQAVRQYPGVDVTEESLLEVYDNGAGQLVFNNVTEIKSVGTINYSNGNFTIGKSITGKQSVQSVWSDVTLDSDPTQRYVRLSGAETRSLTATVLAAPTTPIAAPPWAWWTGTQTGAARAQFAGVIGTAYTTTVELDEVVLPATSFMPAGYGYGISSFTLGGVRYFVNPTNGGVYKNINPSTGEGTLVGGRGYDTIGYYNIRLDEWNTGSVSGPVSNKSATASASVTGDKTPQLVDSAVFHTAVSPVKNGSFSVAGTFQGEGAGSASGTAFSATADSQGKIASGSAVVGSTPGTYGVFGTMDYTFGVARLRFGRRVPDSMAESDGVTDLTYLGITGVKYVQSIGVQADTLRYNASAYTYLPLDADLIGVDPVRLPSDGRVPIFRSGSFAVIGESHFVTQTVSNGDTVDMGQVRLSRLTVKDVNGVKKSTGFTVDLESGEVTFTNTTGWAQPMTMEARVEDMMLVSDAQINGQLTFTRPVSHDYSDEAFVSSALVPGTLYARVSLLFDQASWDGVTFSDTVSGGAAVGTYNDTLAPIEVTNAGASSERFAIHFTSSTAFRVVGEHVGVIGTGNINEDCYPLNDATGEPYFTIRKEGWGAGWAVGNILRINTVGALTPVWVVRTVQQGPNTGLQHSTTLLARGDVDRP